MTSYVTTPYGEAPCFFFLFFLYPLGLPAGSDSLPVGYVTLSAGSKALPPGSQPLSAGSQPHPAGSQQGWEKTQIFEKTRDPRVFSKKNGFFPGFFQSAGFFKI